MTARQSARSDQNLHWKTKRMHWC